MAIKAQQNVNLDPETRETVRAMAEAENRSISNMVLILIREALARRADAAEQIAQ